MASQITSTNTVNDDSPTLSGVRGSFGTPANQGDNKKCSAGFITPNQTPIRNRGVQSLRNGSDSRRTSILKIPESPLMQRLGYGTGVGVYLLERSPRACGDLRSPWAIKKTIHVNDTSLDESHEIFAGRIEYEAEILKQLSHPNIIGYRSFEHTSPGTTVLAMEVANKSLADLIEDRIEDVMTLDDCDNAAPFPANQIKKVALDVAKALTYLHDEVRMIHGDLKSANVLVFGDFEKIKLCDFGVARRLAKDGTVEGSYVGTEIWCPMEVIKAKRGQEHVPITHKADIFPFGLTIHEMITLKPPHLSSAEDSCLVNTSLNTTENEEASMASGTSTGEDTLSGEDDNDSFDEFTFEEALSRHVGTRPPLPDIEFDSSYTAILGIFYCCTEDDPLKRPDAKDIVAALTEDE